LVSLFEQSMFKSKQNWNTKKALILLIFIHVFIFHRISQEQNALQARSQNQKRGRRRLS
jgi:uncharacterized membrane protein SirB2